jgi:ABC-type transporter Mla MlaB component
MLRITQTQGASGEASLTLEGRLVGPWVAELKSAVTAARLSSASSVRLELSGVRFVDAEGLALILGLQDQGVRLRDASPFVRELLKTDGH